MSKENIEEKKDKKDKNKFLERLSSKENRKYITTAIILIIAITICILLLFCKAYLNDSIISPKKKVELKYTETSDSKKSTEGVYITDVSEVVENVMPSIVAITSKTQISAGDFGPSYFRGKEYAEGAGSGVIISKTDNDIMILTNNHVVEGAEELSVQFINEKSYDASIVGTSDKKDIAIISVPISSIDSTTLESIKIASLGDSEKLKVGNGIIAIGNALGYGQSVTTGVVSAVNREVEADDYTNKMIQIDAAINGGNSGGALLNSKGEVVGINSLKYSSNTTTSTASIEGMGFAIPISDVKDLIESLINGEGDNTGSIGVEGNIINNNYNNIPTGFYISKIVEGSGADKANLEIGNIITKINGNEINDRSDIKSILNDLKKGDVVTLTVSYANGREYKEKEVKVTLS